METPSLKPSLRRSSRISAAASREPVSTMPPPMSPTLNVKKSEFNPFSQNAFSSRKNSSIGLKVKTDSESTGAENHTSAFSRENFQLLCDKQKKDFKTEGGDDSVPRTPSQIVQMLWTPREEKKMELLDEVNEWVEFLPNGDGKAKVGAQMGGGNKENAALHKCKWILTTRSQDASGSWNYIDRQATREEILKFKEKGWPWYR